MKLVILFIGLLALASAFPLRGLKDSRSSLKLVYDGFFKNAELDPPKTVMDCYKNDEDAATTFHFFGTLFKQMVKNNVVGIHRTVELLQKTLPEEVSECLNKNPEMIQVKLKYGCSGLTLVQITDIVIAYGTRYPVPFHQHSLEMESGYMNGDFVQVGVSGGKLAQKVFKIGSALKDVADPAEKHLFSFFKGLWEQINLPNPTTPHTCFDSASAQQTLDFIETLTIDFANNNFFPVPTLINNFMAHIPAKVLSCWNADSQVLAMNKAYNLTGLTVNQIRDKVLAFAATHYSEFHPIAVQNLKDFDRSKYELVGKGYGQILQKSIK